MTEQKDEWPYRGARDVCWYCGGRLIWQNDYDYADIYGEGEGIATELICQNCGARVEYTLRTDEDE